MTDTPNDFEAHDFFLSNHFVDDPYRYFDYLRDKAPVVREPHQGIVMVTGYAEALEIYNDPERFSSCMSTTGPFAGCPIPLAGHENEDISALIEEYRDQTAFSDQLPTMDPPTHTAHRALLMSLITPKRLKENEEFMWRLADEQIDTFLSRGKCEFMDDFAQPFAVLVVSDLRWIHDEVLQQLPTISLGGPGVNILAHRWLEELPLSLAVDEQYYLQMDPDLDELRASLWGMDNPTTQIAVSAFIQRLLPRFLERCVAEAPDPIDLDDED